MSTFFKNLSWFQLCQLESEVSTERQSRERSDNVLSYQCVECGKQSLSETTIVNHLRRTHHYPYEDACVGTQRIYN